MTGYVRKDTTNNIADGNVINAADLDSEFDGVQAAFNSSTGHTHDGTASEGAPITKLGPVQDVTVSTTVLGVKTTNTVDLGTSSLKFKDFYLAGAASIGGATTLSAALTYGGVTLSNAVTGTGNMVLSASPTLTGTITAAAANFSGAVALNGNTTIGDADTDTITQAASYVTGTQLKSAKTATNTLSLAAYDVDGVAYTNLITLTASNTPTLALTSTGVGTINNMSIGATTASTGAFTTLSASSTVSGTGFTTYLASPPAIGGTAAAAGTFTTLSSTGNTTIGDAVTDTITVNGQFVTGTVFRSAQAATNTLSLAAYDVDGVAYTNLITLTASNTPTLALTSIGVGTINNMSIGATTASTGAFTTLTSNGATTFTAGTASTTTGTGTLVITGGLGVSGRINAANFDGVVGANTAAAGSFTTLTTSSTVTHNDGTANGVAYLNGSKVLTTGSALVFDGTNLRVGTTSSLSVADKMTVVGGNFAVQRTSGITTFMGDNTVDGYAGTATNQAFALLTNSVERARIDTSGNLGLGVTPSAWFTSNNLKAVQLGGGSLVSYLNNQVWLASNYYLNSSGQDTYVGTGASNRLIMDGAYKFFTAPSGTAGNAITFTQAMTLNASGYLAIGDQTSPTTRVDIRGTSANVASTVQIIGTGVSTLLLGQNADGGVIRGQGGNNCITFWTGGVGDTAASGSGSERARIDSSGNLLVGTTSVFFGTTNRTVLSINGTSTSLLSFGVGNSGKAYMYSDGTDLFIQNNIAGRTYVVTNSAGVYLASGGTSWTSNSDERKKDIIEPIANAISKVSALRAVIGKFKTDEENTRRSFLIAQDVQSVLPEAVDASNPDDLGVQYTEVIPLLVAAIKEQSALITTLTARITALEGA